MAARDTDVADGDASLAKQANIGDPGSESDALFLHERSVPGIKLLFAVGPSPESSGRQVHDLAVLNFIIRGRVTQVDDLKNQVDCGPVTINWTPAGMRHEHVFRSRRLMSLCVAFDHDYLAANSCSDTIQRPMILASGPCIATLLKMQSLIFDTGPTAEFALAALSCQLVDELQSVGEMSASQAPPPWLRKAAALLRERCLDRLSIEEVANHVGVHPSHLTRAFRQHLNETPGDYLRRHRLEWAVRQLTRTRKPVQLIASEAGFADQAHFTRHFKRTVGVSPTAFRKSLLVS